MPASLKDGLAGQVLDLLPDDVGVTILTTADSPQIYSAIDLLKSVWWWFGLIALATLAGALGDLPAPARHAARLGGDHRGARRPPARHAADRPWALLPQVQPENRDAVGAIYDVLASSLRSWTLWLLALSRRGRSCSPWSGAGSASWPASGTRPPSRASGGSSGGWPALRSPWTARPAPLQPTVRWPSPTSRRAAGWRPGPVPSSTGWTCGCARPGSAPPSPRTTARRGGPASGWACCSCCSGRLPRCRCSSGSPRWSGCTSGRWTGCGTRRRPRP